MSTVRHTNRLPRRNGPVVPEPTEADSIPVIRRHIEELFTDQYGVAYAVVLVEGHRETHSLAGQWFRNRLTLWLFERLKTPPSNGYVNALIRLFSALASDNKKELANRSCWSPDQQS